MDTVARYRQIIEQLLREYAALPRPKSPVEVELVIDPVGDHYQLMTVGWRGQERVYGSIVHMDIRHGKIWVQYDGTEADFAQLLVAAGVPKSDIVIGFHSPFQ
ncbi:MAG: XisI protein, partial [Chloroflexaceae bacterium]|nr:XisI protein [Chloroflexaceae bacterium]